MFISFTQSNLLRMIIINIKPDSQSATMSAEEVVRILSCT